MRNRILAIAAVIGVISAPIAAQAQSETTTGAARGNTVVVPDSDGINADQRPAFREYVLREQVPPFTVPEPRRRWEPCCRKPASPITTCRRPSARQPIATPW